MAKINSVNWRTFVSNVLKPIAGPSGGALWAPPPEVGTKWHKDFINLTNPYAHKAPYQGPPVGGF